MGMGSAKRTLKRRHWFAMVCLGQGALLLPAAVLANDAAACDGGIKLQLSAPESSQGGLLLVEVKSEKPLAELKGEWDGRSVPFWQEAGGNGVQKGLVGVDLEKAPGNYELKVTGQTASGEKAACSAMLEVKEGKFATEKLTVGKQFVEPSAEQGNDSLGSFGKTSRTVQQHV